jgi:NAD/NADP transhydrogenase beta subunit
MTDNKSNHTKEFAKLLDSKFTSPGTNIRFGIDPIVGLIPGAGDVLAGGISLYFLIQAALFKAKASVLARMFINILLDVAIGSIPVIGDFFDVYWKANLRNARILDELQEHPDKTTTESRLWVWFTVILFVAILIGTILLIGWIIAELTGFFF